MKMTGSHAYTRPTPVPKMPPGLAELMEGMTKEVLKYNPTNVYEFCANHMQKLLEIRDGPTGIRDLTLKQKISRAQDQINLRAQERQQKYDKNIKLMCKIDHKDKELSLQTTNAPVTREMCLTSVEEIEISHCENNKEIKKNVDVITIIKEGSRSDDENIDRIMNESENNNTKSDIKTIEPIEDKHIETPKLKDHSEIKPLETFAEKNEYIVVKETVVKSNTPSVTALKENYTLGGGVEISTVGLDTEQDFTEYSLNNEEVNVSDKISDTAETEKKIENSVPTIKDYLFNDVTPKNPVNTESVSEDNTIYRNDVIKNTNKLTENNNNSNGIIKNSNNDIQSLANYAGNEGVTDNTMLTFNVSILNHTVPGLPSLGKETITSTKQDSKTNEATKVVENNDKPSHLCSDPTIDKSFENSTDAISNDNRETNNMDLETAAITIQKVFRLFLFKSRASNDGTSSMDEDVKEANGYSSPNLSHDRRPLGITRMDTMLQTVNEEKSLSLSTDDSSTLSSAATIIQAHIRGFLVRNKLNSNKTASTNSILNSEEPVTPSTESETNQNQHNNKTVLNIHIVPDGNVTSLSRDESIVTSVDLSLDGSPPSSINLHPLGYDKSEPRKQLKREDAFQSISPPSNNSGKLSEDVDSTKEILSNCVITDYCSNDNLTSDKIIVAPNVPIVRDMTNESFKNNLEDSVADPKNDIKTKRNSVTKMSSDEMDVVTPYTQDENRRVPESSNTPKLMHSGELHDVVLPTNVSRGSTSVVRGE